MQDSEPVVLSMTPRVQNGTREELMICEKREKKRFTARAVNFKVFFYKVFERRGKEERISRKKLSECRHDEDTFD